MHVARWIVVLFLILAIVVSYSPEVRRNGQSWEEVRPAVVEVMDGVYATLRNIVAGTASKDGIDDNAPGVDFELITTMDRGSSSKN